jgi:hypothetical protein
VQVLLPAPLYPERSEAELDVSLDIHTEKWQVGLATALKRLECCNQSPLCSGQGDFGMIETAGDPNPYH